MLRHVALVRTDVSEELSASFMRLTRIGELETMLVTASVVPSSPIFVTLMKEALSSSETSVLTIATQCNIPEHDISHSHHHENLKSYTENIIIRFADWTGNGYEVNEEYRIIKFLLFINWTFLLSLLKNLRFSWKFLCSMLQLLVTANISNSLILFTLLMKAIFSLKTLALTTATWCHVPEDGILQVYWTFWIENWLIALS
jgi:hypothetical protein